jgi:hypothetical protein
MIKKSKVFSEKSERKYLAKFWKQKLPRTSNKAKPSRTSRSLKKNIKNSKAI